MRVGVLVAAGLAVAVAALGGEYAVHLATRVCVFGLAALGLDLTVGGLGRISLGHAGLLGLGAFGGALAARAGAPLPLAALAGLLAGAIGGVVLGLPATRITGPAFAVASLAFGVAVEQGLTKSALTGAHAGLAVAGLTPRGPVGLLLAFAALVSALLAVRGVLDGRTGHRLRAVKDEPIAARALGIDVRRFTLATFAASGALCGLAGALSIGLTDNLHASAFATATSLELLVMVVLGGAGSTSGPALGAAAVVLTSASLAGLGAAQAVLFGAALLAMAILAPGGLVRLGRSPAP